MACALECGLCKAQLVSGHELGGDRHRSADDRSDHRIASCRLVVGHEQDRLPAMRHLHRAGGEPKGKELVARGSELWAVEPIAHPVGLATDLERTAEQQSAAVRIQAFQVWARN